jgi:CheY-like chemotaxis protein
MARLDLRTRVNALCSDAKVTRMGLNAEQTTVLIVDDDDDDRMMIRDAFRESGLHNPLRFAVDGEELMSYLRREGQFADAIAYPTPGLILLDLNMPRKDGREALREIKGDPALRYIPVIVLTTSRSPDDIARSYQHGANSFISKPGSYLALLEMVQSLSHFWLNTSHLPAEER